MVETDCFPLGVRISLTPSATGRYQRKGGVTKRYTHPARPRGEPAALGDKDTADALKRHVDNEDKQILKTGETSVLNVPNRGLAPAIKIIFYMLFMFF